MSASSKSRRRFHPLVTFGLLPAILGIALGQCFLLSDAVWLTNASVFWPIVCLAISVALLVKRLISPFDELIVSISAWLLMAWTWFYFPFWLTAHRVPESSAVISHDGHVSFASEISRGPNDVVWLMAGKGKRRVVHKVEGVLPIQSTELRFRFSGHYIVTQRDEADVSGPLLRAATEILTNVAQKPRRARIALFEQPAVHQEILRKICRATAPQIGGCPVELTLRPVDEAVMPRAIWSSAFTEEEAIEQEYVPALSGFLAAVDTQSLNTDRILSVFLSRAHTIAELAPVARHPYLLDDQQFNVVVERILSASGTANELIGVVTTVSRLKPEQRQALRRMILRSADIRVVLENITALRLTDAEVVSWALRLGPPYELGPELALLALRRLGERLPTATQQALSQVIAGAGAEHALTALRQISFHSELRAASLDTVLATAKARDFRDLHLTKGSLVEMLAPSELRRLTAHVVDKSRHSEEWLDLAVELLPVRGMTMAERRAVIDGLLFKNARSAMEYVSLNHRHLETSLVNEITRDYTKTIRPDVCLHLSHRNQNRRIDYFSEGQLRIFRECAAPH